MSRPLRDIGAGVGTYILGYVLMGLVAFSSLERLVQATFDGVEAPHVSDLWGVYEAAGQPVWTALGWVWLNAHWVILRIEHEPNVITWKNLISASGTTWLYLVPALACVLGGMAVALVRDGPVIEVAVGAYLAMGYTLAAVASTFAFGLSVPLDGGTATVAPSLINRVSLVWPIATIGHPLVFGSLGAAIGSTTSLQSRLSALNK